ncbi:MAG: valine--tRNA ligase [Candidatus Paracaedimonas acanthamoebae]|uniref:Valine--tRNA ligase n=1 Tax=Candidatus Paracaedimonas acanthamoebae TaxID=244581 RepID=A0A8J7PMX5_9PROT|nr:valine--tRNA ligase [Candidatus Paracaedimonas acanthamoebae]
MLSKTYSPQDIEEKHYKAWESAKAFQSGQKKNLPPYALMMPPPNVTGSLHMGHALTYTLQDILVRYHRMRGFDVLYQPGMDHAGIATQTVVERLLEQEGLERQQLGREKFLERAWQWKEKSGGMILNQQRKLGISPDWERSRFTFDEGLNHAVRKVFVDLYNEKLIYRAKRLVNWDPKLLTAVSDLEVKNTEVKGQIWHIRYPLKDEENKFIVVATTRPETLFGDSAVAVHPEDERYHSLRGKKVILPLVGREIPIISDTYCEPEKGTGAVKITPAHDFNDFAVGQRHQLDIINILDIDAHLNENVPQEFQRLERFVARKKVLEALEEQGLLEKVEDVQQSIPYGERSGVILEPRLTDQWFADAAVLAKPALEAVRTGRTKIVPEQWAATYYNWLENIQPWCISRQLWWGHRIPAWYGPDGQVFVAMDEEEANQQAQAHYGDNTQLSQDEDVLDTWFSSALWPFSTLGWPEKTPELHQYYPTTTLVTGLDIIFFWVARMMMMGLKFMGDVPFHTVYLHALVRDAEGKKMSKSKGNIVDPLDLMEHYGADALRFTMAALAAPGRDIKFSTATVEGYRNFATKLWNAARFCEMNDCRYDPSFNVQTVKSTINQWIVKEVHLLTKNLKEALDTYRFHEAASLLYKTIWGKFCDWYLEFAKPLLASEDLSLKNETQKVSAWVLVQFCHLLHPFMPFISEELWQQLSAEKQGLLITQSWPQFEEEEIDAQKEISWVIEVIEALRGMRATLNISASEKLHLWAPDVSTLTAERLKTHQRLIERLARLEAIHVEPLAMSAGTLQLVVGDDILYLPLGDIIDIDAEKRRLATSLKEAEKELAALHAKLNNPEFVQKAPEEIIEKNQARYTDLEASQHKINKALQQLKAF